MKESALVRRIMDAVKEKYPTAYVRKLSDRFTRGLPDILITFGRMIAYYNKPVVGVLFVETKAPGGKVSVIQLAEAAQIGRAKANGCRAIVALTVKEVLDELEEMGAV